MKTTRTHSTAKGENPIMPVKTSMIKLVLIMALIASGGAISLAAGSGHTHNTRRVNTPVESVPASSLYSWIRESLHCPDFMQAVQNVEIWLRVGEDGHVKVLRIESEDARLKAYVMEMINGKNPGLPISEVSRDYHFSIRFQLV